MTATVFAVIAGMLAVLNPCGIALLPGLLSLTPVFAANAKSSTAHAARNGLKLTTGAVGVFGVVAVPVALGAQLVAAAIPWVGFILGVAMIVLAVLVLGDKRITLPGRVFRARGHHHQGGVFLVGTEYGVTSLGCGLPLFLAAVGAAAAGGGRFAAVAVVAAFAAGMAVALMTLAIGTAAIRDRVVRLVGRTQSLMRWMSGLLLLLAGGYLGYYWATALFTSVQTRSRNPLITAIDGFGQMMQRWIDTDTGGWVLAAIIVAAAIAVLRGLWRWARTEPTPDCTADVSECGCRQTTDRIAWS